MKRIFVVEDEAVVAMELNQLLQEFGYQPCGHATRGEAALRQIPEARPDLVLMDINLGKGMTGLDVAKGLFGLIDVPIVFLTAYSDEEITRAAGQGGSYAYVLKPFDRRVLRANIELTLSRHEALGAIRTSEALFRSLFEQAAVGVAEIDTTTGQFLRVNQKYTEILGYSAEELEELTVLSVAHPEDVEHDVFRLEELRRGDLKEFTFEKRYLHKNRSLVWMRVAVSPLRMADGSPARHMVVVSDITETKAADQRLRRSERQLQEAQHLAKLGNWEWDQNADRASLSDQLIAIFGTAPQWFESDAQERFLLLVHPGDRARVTRALRYALEATGEFEVFYRIVRPDGAERHIESRGVILTSEDSRPIGLRGTSQDVTERIRAAEGLAESEERHRQLFTEAIEGIFSTKLDGTILSVNPAFARLLGYSNTNDLIGRNSLDLYMDQEDRHRLEQTQAREDPISETAVRWRRVSGETIHVEIHGRVVRDERLRDPHYQGFAVDITAQWQSAAALRVLSNDLVRLTGRDFFAEVARRLAGIVGADVGFVDRFRPQIVPRIRILGLSIDGNRWPAMEFDVEGTAWETTTEEGSIVHSSGPSSLLPARTGLSHLGVTGFVASALRDATGKVIGHVGVMSRKPIPAPERLLAIIGLFAQKTAAEIERQEAEARFTGVFEFAPDAILIVNEAGSILHANRAAEEVLLYPSFRAGPPHRRRPCTG